MRISLIVVLANLLLGSFVLYQKPRNAPKIAFGLLCLGAAAWIFALDLTLNTREAGRALFWGRAAFWGTALIPAALLHFALTFPEQKKISLLATAGLYLPAAIFALSSPLIIREVILKSTGPVAVRGAAYPFFLLYALTFFTAALIILGFKYRFSFGIRRVQIQYLFLGLALGVIPASITNLILPAAGYSRLIALGPFFQLIPIAAITYAIVRHRLLEIEVILDRLIETVDRTFFRRYYNFRKTVAEISRKMAVTHDVPQLLSVLNQPLAESLGTERTGLYLLGEDMPPAILAAIPALAERRDALVLENGTLAAVPILQKDKLLGVLTASKKLGFAGEEITLLLTLTGQLSLALEKFTLLRELAATEQHLRRADKLAALGTMAAGMAHEIKNPLSSLKVLSQLVSQKFDDASFRQKFLDIVPREIDRIDRIVENLLNFTRTASPRFCPVNLPAVIEEVLSLIGDQLGKGKVTVYKEALDIPVIQADPEQLHQVFLNLFLNALHAMPDGGKLVIRSVKGKRKVLDREVEAVITEVMDTGYGIPKEHRKDIFDPFFTTRHGGTGLGLTVTHRLIENHRGSIEVSSEPGQGTTFTVVLPVATPPRI